MAIILNGTSNALRSINFGSRPDSYSVSGWFNISVPISTTTIQALVSVGNSLGFPTDRGDMGLGWGHSSATFRNNANMHLVGSTYIATPTQGSTTLNVWFQRICVYSGSQLLFYENGALVGTAVNGVVTATQPADWYHAIGVGPDINSFRVTGKVALQAYYDIGLTAADAKALSKYSPEMVRPQNLRSFYPGLRNANNLIAPGGTASNLTFDGDYPPIIT
jgi:hypothetical protein